ncbi:uncharacterized protein [Nicotiana sylvestris]|uniref:uncharacterized protein n=1 Tax=Nicotiana sylvestris TaxID=4096 RepID=UPI00388C86DD
MYLDTSSNHQSNALHVIKAFFAMVQNKFNNSIKNIRTDNGLEFVNTETTVFFPTKGITHQKTCLYTPQQNGIVERKHKYLLKTARALLYQSKLPISPTGNSNGSDLHQDHQQLMSPELSFGNDTNDNIHESASLSYQDYQSSSNSNRTFSTSLEPCIHTQSQQQFLLSDSPSSEHSEQTTTLIHNRPQRTLKRPSYLKDYICNVPKLNTDSREHILNDDHSSPSFSFHTYVPHLQLVSLNALTNDSQYLIEQFSFGCEPESYEEAAAIPAWQKAMNQEFDALYSNHTWDIVPLPTGKKAIGYK